MDATGDTPCKVVTKHVRGGVVRVHIPDRTPEQKAAFLEGLDRAVRKAFPGRRLIMPDEIGSGRSTGYGRYHVVNVI